jgi:hypothetical protein
VDELPDPEDLREKYVIPFYLKMMGFNSVRAPDELLRQIHERARELPPADVHRLLLAPWRPRVMGTWYAIAAPSDDYRDLVHQSLRSSKGSLTAPALMVAVIQYSGPDSLAAIADYERADVANSWGSAGAARAAATILSSALGRPSPLAESSPDEFQFFRELMSVADRVRTPNP